MLLANFIVFIETLTVVIRKISLIDDKNKTFNVYGNNMNGNPFGITNFPNNLLLQLEHSHNIMRNKRINRRDYSIPALCLLQS